MVKPGSLDAICTKLLSNLLIRELLFKLSKGIVYHKSQHVNQPLDQ